MRDDLILDGGHARQIVSVDGTFAPHPARCPRRTVDDIQAGGRLTFTRAEPLAWLGVTQAALKQPALRLSKRGRLLAPRRGFYAIIPLEYRAAGAPPVATLLAELVRLHGAHGGDVVERDGVLVIAIDHRLRPLTCGPYGLQFEVQRG